MGYHGAGEGEAPLRVGEDRKQTGTRRKMEGVIGAAPGRRARRWMMDGEVNRRGKTNGHERVSRFVDSC